MDKMIDRLIDNELSWFPEKGCGYYPVYGYGKYNGKYFDKYVGYAKTKMGKALNSFRTKLVNKYVKGMVLDIGIGSGYFIEQRGVCLGYDVNPKAVTLLRKSNLYFDPYTDSFNGALGTKIIYGVTFFDSLEHIHEPGRILSRLTDQFVFVSIPIFKDLDHVLNSRHFRKDEHFYYFTRESFLVYMAEYGFKLLESRNDEIKCGREDIYTFVFRR